MNNVKIIAKLIPIKYQHKHRLIITCNIITQIPLILLPNDTIIREELGKEQNFWFWNLAILYTLLAEDEVSWHPLNLSISPLPSPPLPTQVPSASKKSKDTVTTGDCGRIIKVDTGNNNSQTTVLIVLYNSLNMSLHFGQYYGQIELILYKKVSYCCFIKTETFSRIET